MTPNQPQNINHDIVRKLLLNSFASIILGIAGYFTVINWFPIFAVKTSGLEDWNLLEGFASLLSLILIIGGFTFAIAEYIGKEKDKHQEELAEEREKSKLSYEIYRTIYEKLTDPEQEAARRWILANIDIKKDDEDIVAWYENTNKTVMLKASDNEEIPEGQKSIKLVLNCFDYIGFIANHYWDADDDSLDWISAPVAKVWKRIGPYVEHVATLRKVDDYYISAQTIGKLCIAWREGKGWHDEKIAENTP
jgi:hypothetical protein